MKMRTARRARPDLPLTSLLALFILLGAPLLGQTYQQVAPKPVQESKRPPTVEAPATPVAAPVANPDQVLVPTLTGLRLVPTIEAVSKSGSPQGEPVVIEELAWLNRSAAIAAGNDFIGHPLTRGDMVRLVRNLVLVCRNSDRPVVDVFAPPQDVSSGVVQIVIMAAKLGTLTVEGNKYFSSKVLLRQMRVTSGHEIAESNLLGDIDRLNQNPFRQVDLVYSRGEQAGTTDIVLRVRDTRPERVYVGYEDSGNRATGLGRALAGFNLGNLWNEDHQASYQYTRSTENSDYLQAHSGSYTVLLPWRNIINVFGDWSEAKTKAAGVFDVDGVSYQAGLRYTIPLPLLRIYAQSLTVGADYKWTNNDLAFNGTKVYTSPTNIAQGVVTYNGFRTDPTGTSQGSLSLFVSPGGIGSLNHNHDFIVQRAGATADYSYLQANFVRVQKLPEKFTLAMTALAQYATARLLPSEQFGMGGASSVRGYDERLINGDDGISGQLEVRSPNQHLLGSIPDKTQFLVFIDAGHDWNRDIIPGEANFGIVGAGPGIRLSIGTHGTIKADYGFQLKRLQGTRSGRLHLSAVLSF